VALGFDSKAMDEYRRHVGKLDAVTGMNAKESGKKYLITVAKTASKTSGEPALFVRMFRIMSFQEKKQESMYWSKNLSMNELENSVCGVRKIET
jgi:hypothetical protein